jgi:hypothetical protein
MLWTSLSKVNGGMFTWLGGVENSLEETANITGGDCVAMKGKSLQGAACDTNFPYVCEKNPPVYALLRSCFIYFNCLFFKARCLDQQGKLLRIQKFQKLKRH